MSGWRLSPRAKRDLDQIWSYTAERWGLEQAESYVRSIATACAGLADGTRPGRSIEHVRPGYFSCPVGSHVMFYRLVSGAQIEVIRILHRRMDVERHL